MQKDLLIFKACSDETRLRILFLLNKGELCVCELVLLLDMPQGKISRHLSILKQAELVQDRREGTWIYYTQSRANTRLKRLLRRYYTATDLDLIIEDKARLKTLTDRGDICIPNPSLVRARETA